MAASAAHGAEAAPEDSAEEQMDYRADFRALLEGVDVLGTFATGGALPSQICPPLELGVANVGQVAFPPTPERLLAMIAAAEQAPYGKGLATVVDLAVRRAWQLDADKVSLEGSGWSVSLRQIVQRACMELGLNAADLGVEARYSVNLCCLDCTIIFLKYHLCLRRPLRDCGWFTVLMSA